MDRLMDIDVQQQDIDWNITGVNTAALSNNLQLQFINLQYMSLHLFNSTVDVSMDVSICVL